MSLARTWRAIVLITLGLMTGTNLHARSVETASLSPLDSLVALDFSRQRLRPAALARLDEDTLPLLRGAIFGKHGRVFEDRYIQGWLTFEDWYRPDSNFQNAMLNDIERANLDLVREREARLHERIEPGDLRWWQDRRMTAEALAWRTRMTLAVLRAEIEAVHGRRFDEPWLQRYFEARYWYRVDKNYDPRRLTDIERANMALIDSMARKSGGVFPGDMALYQWRALPPDLLIGSSFATLRLLRNEVYALHGTKFRVGAMADWFTQYEWYEPRDGVEARLSRIEERNVATIAAHERALRDSLRTRYLVAGDLEGLLAEELQRLRLEIYARHGRIFRRRWEQDYVTSLPWYRGDPAYTDQRLSDVERTNVATIAFYEKHAPHSLLYEG